MVIMVFEIDQGLFDKVTAVLAPQGLTLSDAIVLFKKTAELGRTSFSFSEEELETARQSNCVRLVSEYTVEDLRLSGRSIDVLSNTICSF